MLWTFRNRRPSPFRPAPEFSARLLQSRRRLRKRSARALVGFSLLRRVRPRGHEFRSHRRGPARFQLPDRARRLRDQSGRFARSTSLDWLARRVTRRGRRAFFFLLGGLALGRGHRLHLWSAADFGLNCRSSSPPPFCALVIAWGVRR